MLTIALPKGRIAEGTLEIFRSIYGKEFEFEDRKLILEIGEFKFLAVRKHEVNRDINLVFHHFGCISQDHTGHNRYKKNNQRNRHLPDLRQKYEN